MAFEIYNGTGNGTTMFQKLNEMWDFDSYDDTSGIVATYGNAKFEIPTTGSILRFYNDTTQIYNAEAFQGGIFTIVKADTAIMLSWAYRSYTHTIIIGTLTNVDGSTGKGAVLTPGNSGNYYMVAGTNADTNISTAFITTDVLTQFVQQVSIFGGWVFDNAYRSIFDTSDSKRGLYMIGSDRYYISGRTAIKDE